MNTDIGFGILLMVDSAAYDLLLSTAISNLAVEQNYRNWWKAITKSGHGVMGVLWSFKLHDDLVAPYDDLPVVIEWNQVGYLC